MRTTIIAILLATSAAILTGCPPRPLQVDEASRYTVVWSNGHQYMAVDADDVQVRSEDIVVFPKVVRDGPRGVQPGVKVTIRKNTLVVDRRARTEDPR